MDAGGGWTRVGGRKSKSITKKTGQSEGSSLLFEEVRTDRKVTTSFSSSHQLDPGEVSAAIAVEQHTALTSATLQNGSHLDDIQVDSDHASMPGWHSGSDHSMESRGGRNRGLGRRHVPRTNDEEARRIVEKLERARSVKPLRKEAKV